MMGGIMQEEGDIIRGEIPVCYIAILQMIPVMIL